MGFLIAIGVIVIAITSLSIDGKMRKIIDQNKEVIELLKQEREK